MSAPGTETGDARRLGLPATVALVIVGIVGTGIFATPASVAPYGWLSIPALIVVGIGSIPLAALARRGPAPGCRTPAALRPG